VAARPDLHLGDPENPCALRWSDAVHGADRRDGQTADVPQVRAERRERDAAAGKWAVHERARHLADEQLALCSAGVRGPVQAGGHDRQGEALSVA
jgi:hypothetical protein